MNRTRSLLPAIVLIAGLTVVATAGAPIDSISPDDGTDATGHLELEPHPGPNGQYAFVNDDGEIEIGVGPSNPNLEDERGVSVEAGTRIDDVFTVTYNGSAIDREDPVRVWIEHDDADVDASFTFVSDGRSIEGADANLTLAPNETAAVGLSVDSTGADPGSVTSTFTVHAEFPTERGQEDDPAMTGRERHGSSSDETSFVVSSPEPTLCEATVYRARSGEPTRLDACDVEIADGIVLDSVTFTTSIDDDVEVLLEGNSSPFADGSELDSNATGAAGLGYFVADLEPTAADVRDVEYEIAVDELDPASIRLYGYDPETDTWTPLDTTLVNPTEATSDATAENARLRAESTGYPVYAVGVDVPVFRIEETALDPTTIEVGEQTTVTATVANDGRADGEAELALRANGEPIATKTVAVPAGEVVAVAFEPTFEDPGEYEITVDGESVGELAVVGPETEQSGTGASRTDEPATDKPATDEPKTEESPTDPGATSDADTLTDTDDSTDALEEPAGIDLERTAGLVSFLAIVLATASLVRRMPRT